MQKVAKAPALQSRRPIADDFVDTGRDPVVEQDLAAIVAGQAGFEAAAEPILTAALGDVPLRARPFDPADGNYGVEGTPHSGITEQADPRALAVPLGIGLLGLVATAIASSGEGGTAPLAAEPSPIAAAPSSTVAPTAAAPAPAPQTSATASSAPAVAEPAPAAPATTEPATAAPAPAPAADAGRGTSGDGTQGSTSTDAARATGADDTPPGAPTIDVVSGDDLIDGDDVTAPVAISGTAEAGARVRVGLGDAQQWTVADEDGRWQTTFDPAQIPADGAYRVSALATDAAGNAGPAADRGVVVDRTYCVDDSQPTYAAGAYDAGTVAASDAGPSADAGANGTPSGSPDASRSEATAPEQGQAAQDDLAATLASDNVIRLFGSGIVLDLTASEGGRIDGVDRIDMTGSGDNTVRLDPSQLFDGGGTSQVVVEGDAGDTLVFAAPGWSQTGAAQSGEQSYAIYQHEGSIARLLVDTDIQIGA